MWPRASAEGSRCSGPSRSCPGAWVGQGDRSQAGGHSPTLSSHGQGCSHLLASTTNPPEHYRRIWDPAQHSPVLPARTGLGSLAAPVGLRGSRWNVTLDSKGREQPPALQHWVVGKGWRPRCVPQGNDTPGSYHGEETSTDIWGSWASGRGWGEGARDERDRRVTAGTAHHCHRGHKDQE